MPIDPRFSFFFGLAFIFALRPASARARPFVPHPRESIRVVRVRPFVSPSQAFLGDMPIPLMLRFTQPFASVL